MSTALSASARALSEQMSLAELMADRRIERETLHALLDELVVDEDVTLSHHRALGRLTCASGHLKEGLRIAARILSAEYEQLLAEVPNLSKLEPDCLYVLRDSSLTSSLAC